MTTKKNASNSLRWLAAKIVSDVTNGRSLSDSLNGHLKKLKDPRDRAFVQAMAYGVIRFYIRLDIILSKLLSKPLKAKDTDIHALLLVGLYQLEEMRIPAHAAVAETVNATQQLNKPWARGLVNAILREYLRQREKVMEVLSEDEEALFMHPSWLIDKVKTDWPLHWQQILNANNQHPPFALRVNQRYGTRNDYLRMLKEKNYTAQIIPETQHGIILDSAVPVEQLPGFAEGLVSVQDGAAQLAVELLDLEPNQRVLDACAAPGGKLTHILESINSSMVIAIDKDKERIVAIKENLHRLKLKADCLCADASKANNWWDGKPFDRILLDAPCSASGVIRRHPDIKLLREPDDVHALAQEQLSLLNQLWLLLKPNGVLLYVTCSVFSDENVRVLASFLHTHPDANEEKIFSNWGVACDIGKQILPGMYNMDGFYFAKIRKR